MTITAPYGSWRSPITPDVLVERIVGLSFPIVAGARYQQMEIEYGAFQRRIELGEDVDPARASARYEHGLLRVLLPLAENGAEQTKIVIEVRG